MIKKIEPYSDEWYKRIIELAKTYLAIRICRDCNSPVAEPYCCTFCGSKNP